MKTPRTSETTADGVAWHALPLDDVATLLVTNLTSGLSDFEATSRKTVIGMSDSLAIHTKPISKEVRVFRMLTFLWFGLLFAATFLHFWIAGIASLLILSSFMAWLLTQPSQETRANTLLHQHIEWYARVLRNGSRKRIHASQLAPGDVIVVMSGDFVPADARLFEAESLSCIEAPLVERSTPSVKDVKQTAPNIPLEYRSDMIYMGAYVTSGRGRAIVVATGPDTALGALADPNATHPYHLAAIGLIPESHHPCTSDAAAHRAQVSRTEL